MPSSFESDEFWRDLGPILFTADRWERARGDVDQILQLLDPAPGASILDLACGPGRIALELARRGFRVTGVDRTAAYLAEARERAAADGLDVEFVHADMREFSRPEAFDLAINAWTSFGYFEDPADDRLVLENAYASLVLGGCFLIELMGREALARVYRSANVTHNEDGSLLTEETRVVDNWSALESTWTHGKDGQAREYAFRLRLHGASDLTALLSEVGFNVVAVHGGLDGSPYDHEAKRLVVVART